MRKKSIKITYDFSVNGGAISGIDLGPVIPKNAVITSCITDVVTPMTSGGSATVALAVGGVTLKSATAFDDAAYTGVDSHLSSPAKTNANDRLTFTIATATLTAGKVIIILDYVVTE